MNPAPLGAFVLVLHAHLPWVLGHGRWPHGESWLFEAASDAWLPQLAVLDRLAADGIAAHWTVGLTPILLEQFASDRFRDGMGDWLATAEARASSREAGDSRSRCASSCRNQASSPFEEPRNVRHA